VKSNKEFQQFQKEFKGWQKKFGLTGYQCHFNYEPLEESFADIVVNQNGMVATIRLNSALPHKDVPHKNIKRTAKHEAIHLLIYRLEDKARCRYIQPDEVYEAGEELVIKLEGLIS